MRNTQTLELLGVGSFKVYPVTSQETEYNKINEQGEVLTKKVIQKGTQAKYVYVDARGTEYTNDKVFTDFKGIKVQAIKQTDKVKKYDIVDLGEIASLTEYNMAFLDADETTKQIFREKIGEKAICFKLKKSSVGFSFYKAFIFLFEDVFIMTSGQGNVKQAVMDFRQMLSAKESKGEIVAQKLEIKAEDIADLVEL